MRRFALSLLVILGISLAADGQDKAAKIPKLEKAKLGSIKNVHKCGGHYLTGQCVESDIALMKQAGISKVITLRTDGEIDWDEGGLIKKAGIDFFSVPIGKPYKLTDELFEEIRNHLKTESVLLHCGSANRVGGVWLPFRVLDQGVALDKAVKEARQVGLRAKEVEAAAIAYIKRKQEEAKNKKKSVKPGINKSFLNPELDVDQYVKRFEIESREVYSSRFKILEACDIEEGDVVADVGAGTGLFTQLFSVEVGKGWVYAVDIAPRFLKHIQSTAEKTKRSNITGVLCTEDSVTLPANSVDVVFICDTYHHFEYPDATMKSIHRALKKDGHLIMIDFHRIKGKTREWLMNHVRAGQEVFQKEILDSGFELVDEKKIPGFKENYFLKFRKKS